MEKGEGYPKYALWSSPLTLFCATTLLVSCITRKSGDLGNRGVGKFLKPNMFSFKRLSMNCKTIRQFLRLFILKGQFSMLGRRATHPSGWREAFWRGQENGIKQFKLFQIFSPWSKNRNAVRSLTFNSFSFLHL